MNFQVVGINHITAPVAVREQTALSRDQTKEAYRGLSDVVTSNGLVVLSTCNRTEIYFSEPTTLAEVLTGWERWAGLERGDFAPYTYWYQGDAALLHLFRVAAGLDSMILGETEILGQVKHAYLLAQQLGAAGRLHRVFQTALRVGKRARTETAVGENALSIGHVVVELAERVFGSMKGLRVLILGAGEMAELTARHLRSAGVSEMMVASRTEASAEALVGRVGGQVRALAKLPELLKDADVVVAATKSPVALVTAQMARSAFSDSEHRLRFFFDLSVPRNVEPNVMRAGREIFVYDIDDVRAVVEKNQARRRQEVEGVERIIDEECRKLRASLDRVDIAPVIQGIEERAEAIREREMSRALANLRGPISDDDRLLIDRATRILVSRLLSLPTQSLQHWAREGDQPRIQTIIDLLKVQGDGEDPVDAADSPLCSPG